MQKTQSIPQKIILSNQQEEQLGLRRDTRNRIACTLGKVVKQFADTRNREDGTLAKSVKKVTETLRWLRKSLM